MTEDDGCFACSGPATHVVRDIDGDEKDACSMHREMVLTQGGDDVATPPGGDA